jgi:ankyrin repeat protein
MNAANSGNLAITQLLIDHGADATIKDNFLGLDALLHAVSSGHTKVARYLLSTGKVDIETTDRDGTTPVLTAVSTADMSTVVMLVDEYKANINVKDNVSSMRLSNFLPVSLPSLLMYCFLMCLGRKNPVDPRYDAWQPRFS